MADPCTGVAIIAVGARSPRNVHLHLHGQRRRSEEYWRIVDAADDLSWSLYYYAGAASLGTIVIARDGSPSGRFVATPRTRWIASKTRSGADAA